MNEATRFAIAALVLKLVRDLTLALKFLNFKFNNQKYKKKFSLNLKDNVKIKTFQILKTVSISYFPKLQKNFYKFRI